MLKSSLVMVLGSLSLGLYIICSQPIMYVYCTRTASLNINMLGFLWQNHAIIVILNLQQQRYSIISMTQNVRRVDLVI
jgi:hypothetical protein